MELYKQPVIDSDILKKIIETHFIEDITIKCLFMTSTLHSNGKFECLHNTLMNMFVSESLKSKILEIFCKIQRFVHAIIRLKHIWRFNRAKIYNSDDLYMNPIHIGQKNTMVLFCNNTKYVFQIRELIASVNSCLSNSSYFFTEPIVCKNPYTNLPFRKSDLYNIYFAIRESTFIMPTLFHKYFLSGFNLSNFTTYNEHLINQEYLKTYVENNCIQDISDHVKEMFDEHKINIRIHKNFPKDELYIIMKPYLELYYLSNYSLNNCIKDYNYSILHKKLHEFKDFNPTFGRRTVKMVQLHNSSKFRKVEHCFNNKHIPFFDNKDFSISAKLFMNSHLCKREYYNIIRPVRRHFHINFHHRYSEEAPIGNNNDGDGDGDGDGDDESDSEYEDGSEYEEVILPDRNERLDNNDNELDNNSNNETDDNDDDNESHGYDSVD